MGTYNTIRLMDYSNKFKEFVAGEALYPGMHLERNSSGQAVLSTEGATDPQIMFAFERELLGEGIETEIASDERFQVWFPGRGDEVYALLADEENVVVGDKLAPDGAGHLKAAATNTPVAVALETLDLTGVGEAGRIRAEVL